jgi:hypothetical protein
MKRKVAYSGYAGLSFFLHKKVVSVVWALTAAAGWLVEPHLH